MKVNSKRPIARNTSGHALLLRFHLHCGFEETGRPGIIYIVCHRVLRHPLEHGTSSMGIHLLAKAHIAQWNELTHSEVTELTSLTVDETALAILKRPGSWGITIVSLQRKFTFDIQVDPYSPKWQTKCFKLAARDFEKSEFHQDTWNRNLMLRFVLANSIWNSIWNLELRWSYEALCDDLVLPSAKPLATFAGGNMHWPWMQWRSNCYHEMMSVWLWTDGHHRTQ